MLRCYEGVDNRRRVIVVAEVCWLVYILRVKELLAECNGRNYKGEKNEGVLAFGTM